LRFGLHWVELVVTINVLDDGDEVISDCNRDFYLLTVNSPYEEILWGELNSRLQKFLTNSYFIKQIKFQFLSPFFTFVLCEIVPTELTNHTTCCRFIYLLLQSIPSKFQNFHRF